MDGKKIVSIDLPDIVKACYDNSHGINFKNSLELFYGTQFLPRNFRVTVTMTTHNCVNILTNDVGLVVISIELGRTSGLCA